MSDRFWHHSTRETPHGRRTWWRLNGIGEIRFERHWWTGARHTGIGIEFDDEPSGIQFFVGIPFVISAWLTIGSDRLARVLWRRWDKALPDVVIADLRFHDRTVWWNVWHSKWSWSKGTPRWRSGSWSWFDLLAGKETHSSEITYGPNDVDVPMPEKTYRARVTLHRDTWRRPRWWDKVIDRGTIEVLDENGNPGGYIPIPGKGENSWDCGPDGTYSLTGPCEDVRDLVDKLIFDALRTRRQRGAPLTYADPIR